MNNKGSLMFFTIIMIICILVILFGFNYLEQANQSLVDYNDSLDKQCSYLLGEPAEYKPIRHGFTTNYFCISENQAVEAIVNKGKVLIIQKQ